MKPIRYRDQDGELHDGELVETNGNLSYVEDAETGKGDWYAPFELED